MSIAREKPCPGVALIRIERPEKLNAIDPETDGALGRAWAWAERETDVRCIVLTGAGTRAFSAGADIGTLLPELRRRALENEDDGTFCGLTRVAPTAKPILAAINGIAFGGGLELALACDLRIASETARFALPEVTLGVLAGGGGATRLPRAIPPALAAEMLLTGRGIDAATALRIGLVSRVVAAEDLMPTACEIAAAIAANAPLAVERTLALLRRRDSLSLAEGLDQERAGFRDLIATRDAAEGIAAFAAGRKPDFERC